MNEQTIKTPWGFIYVTETGGFTSVPLVCRQFVADVVHRVVHGEGDEGVDPVGFLSTMRDADPTT